MIGLNINRIELICMITNLIEESKITSIADRNDASMIAIHIVDGLENEAERETAERQRMPDGFRVGIKCPDCEVVQEGSMFLGVASKIVIRCVECKHEAPLSEFRKETPGYGGSRKNEEKKKHDEGPNSEEPTQGIENEST